MHRTGRVAAAGSLGLVVTRGDGRVGAPAHQSAHALAARGAARPSPSTARRSAVCPEVNEWRRANGWPNLEPPAAEGAARSRAAPAHLLWRAYLEIPGGDGERLPFGLASVAVVTTAGVDFMVDATKNVELEIREPTVSAPAQAPRRWATRHSAPSSPRNTPPTTRGPLARNRSPRRPVPHRGHARPDADVPSPSTAFSAKPPPVVACCSTVRYPVASPSRAPAATRYRRPTIRRLRPELDADADAWAAARLMVRQGPNGGLAPLANAGTSENAEA